MVRAAAKNHPSVAIVTSPARYADVLAAVTAGGFTLGQRQQLAAEAFAAHRDVRRGRGELVSSVLRRRRGDGWPALAGETWEKSAVLRYGENPHQAAALYVDGAAAWPRPSSCTARRCPTTTTSTPTRPGGRRYDFAEPAVAIIKHANPCGIAVGADVAEAYRKAHACDPTSAFGGVIA